VAHDRSPVQRRDRCDLPVGCTYDMEVAASKFLHAIRDGVVPLQFLFSGTLMPAA
jgi:hypothetical protein